MYIVCTLLAVGGCCFGANRASAETDFADRGGPTVFVRDS